LLWRQIIDPETCVAWPPPQAEDTGGARQTVDLSHDEDSG
jgi:hypothetical protein